jgi:hypothetical protein
MNHSPGAILYDASGNAVSVIQDGSVYRLRTQAKLDTGHGLATESKQDSLLTELQAKADLTETQPVLAAQGTKGAGSNAWPSALYDVAGNPIDSYLDDAGDRRLRVEANFPPGLSIIIGNGIPEDLGDIVRKYALNSGSSDLRVDGSTTPVEFTYPCDATFDIRVYEIRFLFSARDIIFDGDSFGPLSVLSNGIEVEITYDNGTTNTLATVNANEDLLMFPSPANAILNNTGPKDILVMGMFLGGVPILKAGTSDEVLVRINDDLVSNSINSLRAQVFGAKIP